MQSRFFYCIFVFLKQSLIKLMRMRKIKLKQFRTLDDFTLAEFCQCIVIQANAKEGDENDSVIQYVKALNPHLSESDVSKIPTPMLMDYMTAIVDVLYNEQEPKGDPPVFIKHKKLLFGLEPSVQSMPFGLFTDLQDLSANISKDNLLKIFALLYRPVKSKIGDKVYSLESYEKELPASINARAELFGEILTGRFGRSALVNFGKARMRS